MIEKHAQIQRSITKGNPKQFCCKCGYTTNNTDFLKCSGKDPTCPNLLHKKCLTGNTFICLDINEESNNVNSTVLSPTINPSVHTKNTEIPTISSRNIEPTTSVGYNTNVDEIRSELKDKSRDELLAIISQHRREQEQYNLLIKSITSGNSLNNVRDSLVASLSFLDQVCLLTSTIKNSNKKIWDTNSIIGNITPGQDTAISEEPSETNTQPLGNTSQSGPGVIQSPVTETASQNQELPQASVTGNDLNTQHTVNSPARSPGHHHSTTNSTSPDQDLIQASLADSGSNNQNLYNPDNSSGSQQTTTVSSPSTSAHPGSQNRIAPSIGNRPGNQSQSRSSRPSPHINNRIQRSRQSQSLSQQQQWSRSNSHSYRNNTQQNRNRAPRTRCTFCNKPGHTEDECFRRKNCTYCTRPGHLYEECRTRLTEKRQHDQVKNIIAEQLNAMRRELAPPPQVPARVYYQPNQAFQQNLTTHQASGTYNPYFHNHGNSIQQPTAGVTN